MAMVVGLLIVIGLIGWGIGELVNAAAHGEPPIVGLLLLALPIYAVARALVDAVGPRLVRGWRYGGGNVQRLGAAVAVWLLVSAGLAVGVPQFVPSQRPDTALVAALGPACHGTAVAGAGSLDRTGSRANHLVVLDSDGSAHPWTGYPPMAWRPPNLADAELVACISAEEIKTEIQVCHYVNGPPIHRYRISREVRIIEAATGRVVSQFTVSDDPRACGQSEQRDLTTLSGEVGWQDIEDRCHKLVESGQPGPAPTATHGTARPTPSRPSPTSVTAHRVRLAEALDLDLIRASVEGRNLQYVDLHLTSRSDEPLTVVIDAGTMFDPQRDATQSMVVISDTEIRLDAGDDDSWQVPVACAEMRRDQPSDSDVFSLRPSLASSELRRLLNTRDFGDATFRVQQFAIWTITNNPRRGGYVALGSILNAAGPTDGELTAIRDLFEAAGLDTRDYRALR